MPIKNYTTKVSANRSMEEIQTALAKNGAIGTIYEFEKGTGRVKALRFAMDVKGKIYNFSLPVNWRKFQEVLKRDKVYRWRDEDYVYRVAWRCIRDWVMAQMAMIEIEMIDMPQVFLPFMNDEVGNTLYEKFLVDDKFLLNSGE